MARAVCGCGVCYGMALQRGFTACCFQWCMWCGEMTVAGEVVAGVEAMDHRVDTTTTLDCGAPSFPEPSESKVNINATSILRLRSK